MRISDWSSDVCSSDLAQDGSSNGAYRYDLCGPDVTTGDCVYIDPNPIDSLDEQGHNYFLSRNYVRTKSWGFFGEAYWNVTDNVKVTAGLRLTRYSKRLGEGRGGKAGVSKSRSRWGPEY